MPIKQGFDTVQDVLELTPRKFEELGVKKLGTKMRLKRAINTTPKTVKWFVSCTVQIKEEAVEFRLPSQASVHHLHEAVSRHTGLGPSEFSLIQHRNDGKGNIAFSGECDLLAASESNAVFELAPVAGRLVSQQMLHPPPISAGTPTNQNHPLLQQDSSWNEDAGNGSREVELVSTAPLEIPISASSPTIPGQQEGGTVEGAYEESNGRRPLNRNSKFAIDDGSRGSADVGGIEEKEQSGGKQFLPLIR